MEAYEVSPRVKQYPAKSSIYGWNKQIHSYSQEATSYNICYNIGPSLLVSISIKKSNLGSRDSSEVKSTGCSSIGPEFIYQQPDDRSQPSIMRCDTLFWCADIHGCRMLYI